MHPERAKYTLFIVWRFSVNTFTCVTISPSQLKYSKSGYELETMNNIKWFGFTLHEIILSSERWCKTHGRTRAPVRLRWCKTLECFHQEHLPQLWARQITALDMCTLCRLFSPSFTNYYIFLNSHQLLEGGKNGDVSANASFWYEVPQCFIYL